MASLRELASYYLEDAALGVCWFALWKNGKSWNMKPFWPNYDERRNAFKINKEDLPRLKEILDSDYSAKFVNGWYTNIGPLEDMTVSSLADGLRFQYTTGSSLLCDCI